MDRPRGLIGRAGVALAAPVLAFILIGAGPPAPADIAALAGGWDLVLEGSPRRCRVTLALDPAGIGRALRFPAGCRLALPILKNAGGWHVPAGGTLRLVNAMGEAVLELRAEGQARFVAKTGAGEAYRLERDEEQRIAALPPAPPVGVPQPTPIDAAKAPAPASVPGTYIVDRYTERDVCRIVLAPAPVGATGRHEAQLLDGCRDAGLRAFDPLTWHYSAGRLTLTARRGHEVTLISEREGHWRRDPEVGATLVLRKAAP